MFTSLPKTGRYSLLALLIFSGLNLFAQPGNDLCTTAETLVPGLYNISGTTTGASENLPNGGATCGLGADAQGQGVWYTFMGTGGDWTFRFPETAGWDPEVNVYSGDCNNLTCVTGDDDSGPGFDALVMVINTDPNVTYYMYVHDCCGRTSDFTYSVEVGPATVGNATISCPANTDFTTGTTFLPDATVHWYSIDYNADDVESFEINTFGSSIDTEIGIYDAFGNLIANNDDIFTPSFSLQSQLTFPGSAGLLATGTYFVAVGEWNTFFGATNFDVTTGSDPAGDYVLNMITQCAPDCAITNVVPTDPFCGTGFEAGESYINITFDVVGGSGSYNTFVSEVGETTVFNGGIRNDLPTNGQVTIRALINPMGVEPGDVVEVTVVDQNNQSCRGTTFTVTAPLCPPVTEGTVTLGCDATETATVTGNIGSDEWDWYEFVFDGSSDLVSIDTEGSSIGDTELGIYDAAGTLVASNDDGGSGLLSLLSLSNLPAGTYYVVVGGFNTEFDPDFDVNTGNVPGTDFGDYVINFNASCNEAPVANCQNVTVDANADCMGMAVATDFDDDSTDPDGDPLNFTIDPEGPLFDLGTTNVTLTVSDGTLTSTCAATITVQDTEDPVLTCETDIIIELPATVPDTGFVVSQADINALAVISETDNCATDPNGPFSVGGPSARTFDCSQVGEAVTITLTINDGNGNSDECTVNIDVQDNTTPVLVCETSVTVQLDENGAAEITNDLALISIEDNCLDNLNGPFTVGGPTARMFDCDDLGQDITRRLVFNDANGAGEVVGCDYTVVVEDNIDPVLECQDVTVQLDEEGNSTLSEQDIIDAAVTSITDNCGDFLVISDGLLIPSCDNLGTNAENVQVQDGSGNPSNDCVFNIIVEDNVPPTAICQDVTVQLDAEGMGSLGDGAPTPILITQVMGEFATGGPAFDRPVGNGPVCSLSGGAEDHLYNVFEFSVDADDMYTFEMQENPDFDGYFLMYEGDFDPAQPCVNHINGDDDDGDGNEPLLMLQLNLTPGDYTLVSTTFFDNQTGTFIYDISSANGGNVFARGATTGAVTSAIDGGSTDNCGPLTFSESMTEFTCENVGPNTVTLTVSDPSGNSSTCDATVTVEDNVPPVITTTPQTVVLDDNSGTATLTVADLATATDACGIESLEASQLLFTCEDIGEVEVTITATDVNGNVSTAPVIVTVTFNQPELACRGNINITLNDNCQALVIPQMLLTGNVACLDVFDFDIVVQDSDPSNGPIIDGCGEFTYMISQRSEVQQPATLGFTGDFAPENWGVNDTSPSDEETATTVFTASTVTFTTYGSPFQAFEASAFYQFSEPGTVAFDYDYNGVDAGFDFAAAIYTFEGNLEDIILFTTQPETGSVSFEAEPGFTLVLGVVDDGFNPFPPNSDLASELVVTNFSFTPAPPTPDILDLDFETCWGTVTAEDKTSPVVVDQVAPIDLLCVDVDENRVELLPNNVSRCYLVFGATGATVPGSMSTALRDALSANVGSTAAVVPTFTDGCAEQLEVCVTESFASDAEDPMCNDMVLTRTFTATEVSSCVSASGEENAPAVSSYVITFTRPGLDDLNGDNIPPTANFDRCGVTTGGVAAIRADYPAPRPGDYPFLAIAGRTFSLSADEAVCNIGVTYNDGNPTVTCPNTYKFVRTYTVIDWCNPSEVATFSQIVKVGDNAAPDFNGPTQDRDFDGVVDGDLIFSTNAGNVCAAYLILDGSGISISDNCSDDEDITLTATIYPGGDLGANPIGAFAVDLFNGTPEVSTPIPVGTHLLRYTYADECGNEGFEDFPFTVEDATAPVAICEDALNVSISSGGTTGGPSTGVAVLTAAMVDAGSYDDCSDEVSISIARVNSNNIATEAYSNEVILTCADLGTVSIGLRVEDGNGNVNFCWLDVLVEDKNVPTCIPPGPMNITCVEYNENFPADITEVSEEELAAVFGSALGIDNCEVTVTSSVSGTLNSCGIGSITRTFVAEDEVGFVNTNNCIQQITIRGVHDYRITFPTDEASGCADIPAFDGLDTDEFGCDLITTNVSVDTIEAVNSEVCFTLRVNYDVINFCEFNQLGEPYRIPRDGDGIRNPETQLLYLNVIPRDDANTSDDIAFLSRFTDRNFNPGAPQNDQLVDDGDDNDGSDDDNDNDSEDTQAANGVGFAYAADDSRGSFSYIQYIDVYDNNAPTIDVDTPAECFAGTSLTCTADVTLTFTAADECLAPVVTLELDANYNPGDLDFTGFSPDDAGALGISIALSNDGDNYTINATNVPVGNHAIRVRANDGCGNTDLDIIEFCVEGDKAPTPICIQTLTVTLMPDGAGDGMAAVWASDFIASDVEDCFGNVIEDYSIYREAGFEESDIAVGDLGIEFTCADFGEDVPVRVYAIAENGTADYCSVIVEVQAFQEGLCDGDGGNLAGTIATQNDEFVAGVEVSLTGEGDMDEMVVTNEAGAFAFVNVPMGIDYTIQPAHPVAVDLATVTVTDVVLIGNVILGAETFESDYDYLAADVDQDRTLSVGDMVSIQRVILGLDDNYATGESWGFVPADVDVSNPFAELFPEVYNINDLATNVLDADFVGFAYGDVNSVGRSSASLEVEDIRLEAGQTHTMSVSGAALAGFQGTLELAAGLELVNVSYEGEGGLNLNGAAEGVIAMMFRSAATVNVAIRATEAGLLSDLVSLTNNVTLAEGVNANGTSGALNLNFTGVATAELANALEQNMPNPVADVTTIGFTLAQAGEATLTIRDVAGRTISIREVAGVAGRNQVELNISELGGATGVLSYTLVAGDFAATKKMVVVR